MPVNVAAKGAVVSRAVNNSGNAKNADRSVKHATGPPDRAMVAAASPTAAGSRDDRHAIAAKGQTSAANGREWSNRRPLTCASLSPEWCMNPSR